MTSLNGKTAVVIGGSSGVGKATVKALVTEGPLARRDRHVAHCYTDIHGVLRRDFPNDVGACRDGLRCFPFRVCSWLRHQDGSVTAGPSPLVTHGDVERTIRALFSAADSDLVVRVQGAGDSAERNEAFAELRDSLAMYNGDMLAATGLVVAPPGKDVLTRALSVLGKKHLQLRLFERILLTFGRTLVDPLAAILDRAPGGALLTHMATLRARFFEGVGELGLTRETQEILMDDLERLLNDDYLAMLAEHEEKVQRPRVKKLAQEVLQLVGSTFQRAFQHWHENAARIAEAATRRFGAQLKLGAHPVLIRTRIVDALEEFLWVETSAELSGALSQLFAQKAYAGLVAELHVEVERGVYHQFAEACWDLIAEHC